METVLVGHILVDGHVRCNSYSKLKFAKLINFKVKQKIFTSRTLPLLSSKFFKFLIFGEMFQNFVYFDKMAYKVRLCLLTLPSKTSLFKYKYCNYYNIPDNIFNFIC